MKTKEEMLNFFKTHLSILTIGEDEEGNNVHLEADEFLVGEICRLCEVSLDEYASEQCQKRDELIEARDELIEWLNQECPLVAPPLEPYTNYDLTHNFCDGLRIRLDKIEQLKA